MGQVRTSTRFFNLATEKVKLPGTYEKGQLQEQYSTGQDGESKTSEMPEYKGKRRRPEAAREL
jgi:hypothetical protein